MMIWRMIMGEKYVSDIFGKAYGRWLILDNLSAIKGVPLKVICVCSCGTFKVLTKTSVISGRILSCGCYAREKSAERLRKPDVQDCTVDGIFFKSTFNGQFGVSKCGLVIGRKGLILTPRSQGHYLIVSYSCIHNGQIKGRNKYVHRLVATEWVKNDNSSYTVVNHKDGNKLNNSSDNLEWVDHKINTQHAVDTGLSWNLPKQGQRGFQTTKILTT